ncbi:methyltransferase domain-containing protein [Chelatococcus sp. GCM10030263]|uniref:methyltransferase domain-containing protein n=1 Tax=Chelatococcus sp. GCM10030263 TaxID=3273387 RepID=UPI00361B9DD5
MSVIFQLKSHVARIPIVGPLARQLYRLLLAPVTVNRLSRYEVPRLRTELADATARLNGLELELQQTHARLAGCEALILSQHAALEERLGERFRQLDLGMQGLDARLREAAERAEEAAERAEREWGTSRRSYTELAHRLSLLLEAIRRDPAGAAGREAKEVLTTSPDPLLTTFYATFEDRFRGSLEEIRERVAVFLPDARSVIAATGSEGPIVDLGCGRGEWLDVLSQAGIPCLGIDNNDAQLAAARRRGLPVVSADALTWLRAQPPASIPMISAFHLIEHLPFPLLVQFAAEALRVLTPGGVALFETPNPENLKVGAFTFNFDPTHVKPLPPGLTACLMEVLGFTPVEIRPLHPDPARDHYMRDGTLPTEVAELFFGPRDYAVLAYKPSP